MSNMKSLASTDTPLSCILCSLLWPICGGTREDPPTRAKHSGSQKPLSHNITLQNRTRSYKLKLISLSPFSKVSHTLWVSQVFLNCVKIFLNLLFKHESSELHNYMWNTARKSVCAETESTRVQFEKSFNEPSVVTRALASLPDFHTSVYLGSITAID